MTGDRLRDIVDIRVNDPQAIARAAASRAGPTSVVGDNGRAMIIAADHPARGALRSGDRPMAMANRADLLDRLCVALARPGVTGVLGTADILDDLLLLGALDGLTVIGSMNRGGLAGATFELDDRFTAYDAAALRAAGFDGGKMLLRIDYDDDRTASTLAGCTRAVNELNAARLVAMVEPFIAHRGGSGVENDLTPEAMVRAVSIASGIGNASAYTWLKVPVVEQMERVVAASSLPTLLLGGEVAADPETTYARWAAALEIPTVKGLVVGRSLLYPADDDVVTAVDTAARLL
ncbi:Cgl0159 family (beta/alpha)8-fold protein [Halostreptopolyspora alba]|uniref:Aldolase n=1 Tax=Halostreptopolyspora alba TaxID=2487137 RepID=A0A3N0E823_9ACTN|nr:aldolase [Nocardiopsaceae bacterium YIM 96095]